MEYYQVFLKVILKEIKRFQLNTEVYSTFVNQLTASLDGNFDVSYNRCAYMYKYASNWLYFFKDCVNLFLLDCSDAKDMLSEWKKYSEVNVCSLSIGPGLDYLAFVLAILENDPLPPNFTGATVISKHGAWRNTMSFLFEVFHEQGSIFEVAHSKIKCDNMKVIQADLLKSFSENRTIVSLSDAHVVLMMKTLNLLASGTPQEGPVLNMLKGLISSLKSHAVIFFIDTKPSLALISQALSNFPGKFLYSPIYRSTILPGDFSEIEGCPPATRSRGAFFVWQKLPSFSSMVNLSTSLDMMPVGTEYKSKLTVPYNSDVSSFTKNEINNDKGSDNVPLLEQKTLWESSSPAIQEILKKLKLSEIKSPEQIQDTNFQAEKVDVKTNEHLNITHTQFLEGAEVLSSVCEESTLTTDNNLISIHDYSYLQNSSVDSNSFDSFNSPSPTETLNSINSPIYENIGSYSKIEKMDPVSDIKKLNNDEPDRIEANSGGAIIFRDDAGLSSDKDKTANALDSNPTSSTSLKILTEQINHFVNVSFDARAKKDSVKTKIHSEEYTIGKGAAVMQEKIIQTDSSECSKSTSLKELTDCIKHLVSSLESMTQQNDPPDFKICDRSPNNTHNQHHLAPNSSNIHNNMPSCSKFSPNYGFTETNNLPSYECANEKKAFQCINCSSRCHCHHNKCNIMQLHCCSRNCHFHPCHSQFVPTCNFSCNTMPCEEHLVNPTPPNIVIPLQNISEEALLKIVSLLKSKS